MGFLAKAPGIYDLATSTGTYAIAVNLDWGESPRPAAPGAVAPTARSEAEGSPEAGSVPAWPIAAGLALALLAVETAAYQRPEFPRRRT